MKRFLKYAFRSRSMDFAKRALRQNPTGIIAEVDYAGKPVCYREGTSDPLVIYEILLKGRKSEYWHARLPSQDKVKVVLDIGANIGAATAYFATLYPEASIHVFEPVPDNFQMLKKNAVLRGGDSLPLAGAFRQGR